MQMKSIFNVEGKIVLITGSSRGIGFCLARGFCEAGAIVVLNSTSETTLKSSLETLQRDGFKVFGHSFDVTNETEVVRNIALIEENIGPISVLINNAGIHRRAPLEKMTLNNWKAVLDVDLNSAFIVSQAVAKYMIARKAGRIINITSLNSEAARPTIANYCAAKGGLKMFTKSMATEWGKYNILTNAIGPGYFLTDLTKPLADDAKFDEWVKSEVPLQRWGKPEELIGTAIFLSSDAASYINGHTIYIDGGWQACL
jgi:gluconate 5-dehydrogenase